MTDKRDAFLAHEALDRLASLGSVWQQLIVEHAFVQRNPALAQEAGEIAAAIGRMYQAAGELQDSEGAAIDAGEQ
ncbi:hypothetical protein ACRAQ6_07630 [Erythrobacter sp. HA6-11]